MQNLPPKHLKYPQKTQNSLEPLFHTKIATHKGFHHSFREIKHGLVEHTPLTLTSTHKPRIYLKTRVCTTNHFSKFADRRTDKHTHLSLSCFSSTGELEETNLMKKAWQLFLFYLGVLIFLRIGQT